jgi:hypothetical protein
MLPSRAARSLGLRPHPLRRGVDVVQAWLSLTAVLALLLAAPLAAWAAGDTAYRSAMDAAREATRDRVRVDAVLLEDSFTYTSATRTVTSAEQLQVEARWYGRDAAPHVGKIVPETEGRAGSHVPLWIDKAGNPVAPPLSEQQITERTLAIGFTTLLASAVLIAVLWLFCRHLLDRHRMALWEIAWAATEPRWSGRRRQH